VRIKKNLISHLKLLVTETTVKSSWHLVAGMGCLVQPCCNSITSPLTSVMHCETISYWMTKESVLECKKKLKGQKGKQNWGH
jgi:hypothetical protein